MQLNFRLKVIYSYLILTVLSTLCEIPVFAQTDVDVNSTIQLNFSTPGARSLALGGAFIALADDATAAFTNPAGLTRLHRQEVSLELRHWSFTHSFTDRGNLGRASGLGVDFIDGLVEGESGNDVTGLSFVSYTYPKDRWVIAFYRHELANFEATIESHGPFVVSDSFRLDPETGQLSGGGFSRLFPFRALLDLGIVNWGLSGAYRLRPNLSLGAGLSHYEFELRSTTTRYSNRKPITAPAPGSINFLPGFFFGGPDFSDGNILNIQTEVGDDTDLGGNAGFIWDMNSRWSLGAVYRQGPRFSFLSRNVGGPAAGDNFGRELNSVEAAFKVPDVLGAGVVFRPLERAAPDDGRQRQVRLTIVFDYDRVEYSDLTSDVKALFVSNGKPETEAAERLKASDADELHLGVEIFFYRLNIPLAIRAGAWYDPDHRTAFTGELPADLTTPETQSFGFRAALFREGDNTVHYAVGVGAVFRQNIQLDAAVGLSERDDTGSLSVVVRF